MCIGMANGGKTIDHIADDGKKDFTDKDIIKALECCNTEYDDYQCPHCPMLHKGCKKELIQQSLALINRQQLEIEQLKLEWKACSWKKDSRIIILQETIAEQKAEIDSLRKTLEEYEDAEAAREANDYM